MQRTSKQLWQGDGATLQPVCCVKQQPCSLWTTSELIIYMLPFIFTNVTQIFCCYPDTHKERIGNCPTAENYQISVTLEGGISVQAPHPFLPSSLFAPLSLLCTGVWSCFLMSTGTAGVIALSPSVVTFCTCYKALLIQCAFTDSLLSKGSTGPKVNKSM